MSYLLTYLLQRVLRDPVTAAVFEVQSSFFQVLTLQSFILRSSVRPSLESQYAGSLQQATVSEYLK
jgi:hypothetical protein